eukprot:scaffold66894_cov70-Phaeocystis_antarctica.AAC.1
MRLLGWAGFWSRRRVAAGGGGGKRVAVAARTEVGAAGEHVQQRRRLEVDGVVGAGRLAPPQGRAVPLPLPIEKLLPPPRFEPAHAHAQRAHERVGARRLERAGGGDQEDQQRRHARAAQRDLPAALAVPHEHADAERGDDGAGARGGGVEREGLDAVAPVRPVRQHLHNARPRGR